MQILSTLGWLACVIYSTIPLFWLMVHPRAHKWREKERSPFRELVPAWFTMWVGVGVLPEVRADHREGRLITTGIRARVRHPVYLAHLCEMLAWSVGTGLVVCWMLTAFAVATGMVMIRMEDAELEKRFGEEYKQYRATVPAVVPKVF